MTKLIFLKPSFVDLNEKFILFHTSSWRNNQNTVQQFCPNIFHGFFPFPWLSKMFYIHNVKSSPWTDKFRGFLIGGARKNFKGGYAQYKK